jgi:hypothetical protein
MLNLTPTKMKDVTRARTLITLFVLAMALAGTPSCEESEGMEVRNESTFAKNGSNSAFARTGTLSIDSKVGDPIDLATAKRWADNYRSALTNADDRRAHYFGYEIIKQVLSQSDCIGIRIYYGIDEVGNRQLMLIGVDSNGNDLLPLEGARSTDEGNIIADGSFPCPNTCPENGL